MLTSLGRESVQEMKFVLLNVLCSGFLMGMTLKGMLTLRTRQKLRKYIRQRVYETAGMMQASVVELLVHTAREETNSSMKIKV